MDTQLESIKARFDEFFDAYHKDDISYIITSFPTSVAFSLTQKCLADTIGTGQ